MGKTKLNAGRKEAESVRSHVAPWETDVKLYPVSHSLVAIHRLIEMG